MTPDEARLMANVNARAQHLFEDGYRARWAGPHIVAVRNGQGTMYLVDTQAAACDCPFFRKSGHQCKHLLGWRRLLARQRACRLWIAALLLRVWSSLDDAPQGSDVDSLAQTPGRMPGSPGEPVRADGRI